MIPISYFCAQKYPITEKTREEPMTSRHIFSFNFRQIIGNDWFRSNTDGTALENKLLNNLKLFYNEIETERFKEYRLHQKQYAVFSKECNTRMFSCPCSN